MSNLRVPRFRDLPLFGKLLIPFLTLMLFLGVFGVGLIVRDLSSRAQAALDQDLSRRSLDARALLRDRELYLLESVNFAANLAGMAEGIRANDAATVANRLQSVLALKTDLTMLVATDARGVGMVEFLAKATSVPSIPGRGTRWAGEPFVQQALRDRGGNKSSGFLRVGGNTILGIASPVCSSAAGCGAVGAAIVGIRVEELATTALGKPAADGAGSERGNVRVSIYDAAGHALASVGSGAQAEPTAPDLRTGLARRTRDVGGEEFATLFAPLEIQGRRAGTLAVSVPTALAFSSVRGTGFRLALVLLAALAGVVALGAMLSRLILRQVRPLVEANRAFGKGDLGARVPVLGRDELGELAQGANQMAEQLQASYETLELRVAQRTEEVRRLLKERNEFFAAMSHELRTPLAIIQGQAEMMKDPTYPKTHKWVGETGRTISDSSGQLLGLVNDILELARAEAGRIEVNIEDVDLAGAMENVRPTMIGLARVGGLRTSIDIAPDLPEVRADRRRLHEIIVNLVDNAVKYTPSGEQVTLSAQRRNGTVEVSVSDTGVGIPPETGDLVFEPFYRVSGAKPQRGQASSGLGLALAKRLVEAQGGTIWYTIGPERGTTFTFTLVPSETKVRAPRKKAPTKVAVSSK